MKQLALAYLFLFLSFWVFQNYFNESTLIENLNGAVAELDKENTTSYVLIVENAWAHHVHRLWRKEGKAVILAARDMQRGYIKKKKRFDCNKNVYWLGYDKPPSTLNPLGKWKAVSPLIAQETKLNAYALTR